VKLTSLELYEQGRIVHVEDEPAEVYAQLAAQGLTIGTVVRMVGANADLLRLDVGGAEQMVAPVVGSNVSVERIAKPDAALQPHARLAHMACGERARVVSILPTCRGLQRRRLLDLGLVPGTEVEVELESASGDPRAFRVRGALIALRRSQAEQIQVTKIGQASSEHVLGN
jgi:DtxR family Mn-dependent transcriptional regulator